MTDIEIGKDRNLVPLPIAKVLDAVKLEALYQVR